MTVREIYEAVLVEVNKENAQSFTIEEFNYIINKATLAFVNKRYNFYPTNQQLSDDLRVLVKKQTFSIDDEDTSIDGIAQGNTLNPTSCYLISDGATGGATISLSSVKDLEVGDSISFGDSSSTFNITNVGDNTITTDGAVTTVYKDAVVNLESSPVVVNSSEDQVKDRTVRFTFSSSDYLHLISCRVLWKTKKPSNDAATYIIFPAKRLTYDMLNAIQNNTYLNPAPNRPYYQTFDNTNNSGLTTFPSSLNEYKDYQNKPVMELHVGEANTFMELAKVEFDYLKTPELITLLDSDIFTAGVDNSQVLEWPYYVKNEIVKLCTLYLLEKASDPRVQTQPMVNQETPDIPMNIAMSGSNVKQQTEKS